MTINKSPATPPATSFPLPDIDNWMPSLTPAGIFMAMTSSVRFIPELSAPDPLLSTSSPAPPHDGQVALDII